MRLRELMLLRSISGGGSSCKNLLDAFDYASLENIAYYGVGSGELNDIIVNDGNSAFAWYAQSFNAGTYTLSCNISGEGISGARLLCSKSFDGGTYNDSYGGYYADLINNKITFTVNDSFSIGLCILTGTVGQQGKIYDIMFEKGSIAHAYIAYEGGYNELSYIFKDGCYIDNDGSEVAYDGWTATSYIALPDVTQIFRIGAYGDSSGPRSSFYDSDHNFISSFEYYAGMHNITVPANAKYVRVSCVTTQKPYLRIQAK